jgi:hypothetical protein
MGNIKYWLVLILGGIAGFFKFRGDKLAEEKKVETQRADIAEAGNDLHHRVQNNLNEVRKRHRREDGLDKNTQDDDRRNHLDNNW